VTFKDRDPALYQKYRSQLRSMMAMAGMGGVLEVLTDIALEFGDGATFPTVDPFWLNAAQIDDCKEKIEVEIWNLKSISNLFMDLLKNAL
jgi:hypothetical protein